MNLYPVLSIASASIALLRVKVLRPYFGDTNQVWKFINPADPSLGQRADHRGRIPCNDNGIRCLTKLAPRPTPACNIITGPRFMSMAPCSTAPAHQASRTSRALPLDALTPFSVSSRMSTRPSRSLVLGQNPYHDAVRHEGLTIVWLMLLFASAGDEHLRIKTVLFSSARSACGAKRRLSNIPRHGISRPSPHRRRHSGPHPGPRLEWLYKSAASFARGDELSAVPPSTTSDAATLLVLAPFACPASSVRCLSAKKPGTIRITTALSQNRLHGQVRTVMGKVVPAMTLWSKPYRQPMTGTKQAFSHGARTWPVAAHRSHCIWNARIALARPYWIITVGP